MPRKGKPNRGDRASVNKVVCDRRVADRGLRGGAVFTAVVWISSYVESSRKMGKISPVRIIMIHLNGLEIRVMTFAHYLGELGVKTVAEPRDRSDRGEE